jgi:hypothetical protein
VFRRRKDENPQVPPPREIYDGLRGQILHADPATIGLKPTESLTNVWGALLETGYSGGVATVVSLGDGTTSLYTTSGFGIIGGGGHEQVVQATIEFLHAVEGALPGFEPDADDSLPAEGETVLRALTFGGRLAVRALEADFGNGRHPLSAVFHAGQGVITQLRLLDVARPRDEG